MIFIIYYLIHRYIDKYTTTTTTNNNNNNNNNNINKNKNNIRNRL